MNKRIRINVFLTNKEYQDLKIAAEATGTKKSTLLRKMAFSKTKTYTENLPFFLELQNKLDELITESGRQGVNLNQAVKKLNRQNADEMPTPEIFNAIQTATKTAQKLYEIQNDFLKIKELL